MCLDLDRLKWLCFLADFCHTDEKEGNDYNDRLSEQFKQMPDHFFSSSSSSYFFRSSFILFLLFCPRDRSFNVAFLFLEYTYIYIWKSFRCVQRYISSARNLSSMLSDIYIFYRIYYTFYFFLFSLFWLASVALLLAIRHGD